MKPYGVCVCVLHSVTFVASLQEVIRFIVHGGTKTERSRFLKKYLKLSVFDIIRHSRFPTSVTFPFENILYQFGFRHTVPWLNDSNFETESVSLMSVSFSRKLGQRFQSRLKSKTTVTTTIRLQFDRATTIRRATLQMLALRRRGLNKLRGRPSQYAPLPASWPLTFWPWKRCPSHVWRGLPRYQF